MGNDFSDLAVWWREYARCYDQRSWRDYRQQLAEVVASGGGGPVLDVGCGYGFLVECARQFGIPAIGLEGAPAALAVSAKLHFQADVRPWQAGTPFGLEGESVGTVLVNEVVDHLTLEHNRLLFENIHRVLRPDGRVIVKSPSKGNRFETDKGHITFFTPTEFKHFVEAAGLEVVSQPYLPQPLLGQSRLGLFLMRMVSKIFQPERWAARIDLVARKRLVADESHGQDKAQGLLS